MENQMWAKEDWVNKTRNYRCGSSEWYETFSTNQGDLYRAMRREYGRCTGKVYVDGQDGFAHHVGWVFQQRKKYDDCAETFLAETWVTFRKGSPEPHCTACGAVSGSGRSVTVIQ